jgi:hypothetical protein
MCTFHHRSPDVMLIGSVAAIRRPGIARHPLSFCLVWGSRWYEEKKDRNSRRGIEQTRGGIYVIPDSKPRLRRVIVFCQSVSQAKTESISIFKTQA